MWQGLFPEGQRGHSGAPNGAFPGTPESPPIAKSAAVSIRSAEKKQVRHWGSLLGDEKHLENLLRRGAEGVPFASSSPLRRTKISSV